MYARKRGNPEIDLHTGNVKIMQEDKFKYLCSVKI